MDEGAGTFNDDSTVSKSICVVRNEAHLLGVLMMTDNKEIWVTKDLAEQFHHIGNRGGRPRGARPRGVLA